VAMLQEDVTATRTTTVRGPDGVLAKLRGYFVLQAWVLEEATCEQAEKAKTQDGHMNGDGTTPPPATRGEEVATKTVMASLVHKENLEEARHVMPEVRTTRDRAKEIQRTPPAGYNTNPGDLGGGEGIRALDTNTTMAHFSWVFPVRLRHIAALTQRIGRLVPIWRKERGMGAAERRFDELKQLQGDLQAQLAGTEEDWD
jgi:hypothetical protein